MTPAPERTITITGDRLWQPRRGQLVGPAIALLLLSAVFVGYGVALVLDRSLSMTMLGVTMLAAFACGAWMLTAHTSLRRRGVVRAEVTADGVRFGGARGIRVPLLLLAPVGAVMLAAWAWSLLDGASGRLTVLTIVVTPLLATLLIYGGLRPLRGAPAAHSLELTPTGLRLRIPRNDLTTSWDDIEGAECGPTHVVVRTSSSSSVRWAVRDLGSDPVVLADLISFYAANPAARSEVGAATLDRLQTGAIPAQRA